MNQPFPSESSVRLGYQKTLLGHPAEAMKTVTHAIEMSLGARHPSGLIIDADNSLGLSTPALLENGYSVLSLSPPPGPSSTDTDYCDPANDGVMRMELCAFGSKPKELNDLPDGIVVLTDVLSTLPTTGDMTAALSLYFDLLRPGGSIVLACPDFGEKHATDPSSAHSDPVLSQDSATPSIFMERRYWEGNPRKREFTTEYIRMTPEAAPATDSVRRLAITMGETSELLRAVGFQADALKSCEETGFHCPIAIATKPPVPTAFFAPRPLDLRVAAPDFPGPESEKTKFQFFPEDMDPNPFEELPGDKNLPALPEDADGARPAPDRKQVTLVMLSGGIDSVYVLQRVLQESEDEVVAHHIHFVNREGRHKAEDIACKRAVSHLRETIRPFHYTESTIDRRRFEAFGMDDMCVGFEVGIISNSFQMTRGHPIDRWTSGTCLEEELEYYGSDELARFEHVLNSAAASSYPGQAPRYFQLKIIPKREQLDYMGKVLVDLCWTCRTPIWAEDGTPSECGTCKTCTLMAKIKAGEETIAHKPEKRP